MEDGRLLSREVIVPSPKRFIRETLEMPDGAEIDWYYIDAPASVMVVPVTASGHVVMVRQYRHNLKSHALELPAGMVSDGEDPTAAAARELAEETGYRLTGNRQLRPLGSYYSLPSETNKYTHIYLARPVAWTASPVLDTEIERYFDMSVTEIPLDTAFKGIGTSICGMETVAALMMARAAEGL
jgi:ADP-ribose diphosphatase